jgi:hypothetical protein
LLCRPTEVCQQHIAHARARARARTNTQIHIHTYLIPTLLLEVNEEAVLVVAVPDHRHRVIL